VTTHLGLMAVFSLFVSVAFAALMRETPGDQLRFGARLFAGFFNFEFKFNVYEIVTMKL